MQRFTDMFLDLDATCREDDQVEILKRLFAEEPARDAAWALFLLAGQKLIRGTSARLLRDWVSLETGYPPWLVAESYDAVGDLPETLALLLPDRGSGTRRPFHEVVEHFLLPMRRMGDGARRDLILEAWREMNARQRLVFHMFVSDTRQVGVPRHALVRALAMVAGLPAEVIATRLADGIEPTEEFWTRLLASGAQEVQEHRPYPFFLAQPFHGSLEHLGGLDEWQIEYNWDGVRSGLIHRHGPAPVGSSVLVCSCDGENISPAFREICEAGRHLPEGTVLDGQLLAWEAGRPLPFRLLQRRMDRQSEDPARFAGIPVVFMAFDLLEWGGLDVRGRPLSERRAELERVLSMHDSPLLRLSPVLPVSGWHEVEQLRREAHDLGVDGVVLKRKSSTYGAGPASDDWWEYLVEPSPAEAVMLTVGQAAAEPAHGPRVAAVGRAESGDSAETS